MVTALRKEKLRKFLKGGVIFCVPGCRGAFFREGGRSPHNASSHHGTDFPEDSGADWTGRQQESGRATSDVCTPRNLLCPSSTATYKKDTVRANVLMPTIDEAHCCDTSQSLRLMIGRHSKATSSEQAYNLALVK